MCPKVATFDNSAQIWTFNPLISALIHQRVILEGPESLKSIHWLIRRFLKAWNLKFGQIDKLCDFQTYFTWNDCKKGTFGYISWAQLAQNIKTVQLSPNIDFLALNKAPNWPTGVT